MHKVDLDDLQELWKESLKLNYIDPKLNYFQSGGASLEIMSLIAKVNSRYNCQIDIKRFFQNPTFPLLEILVTEAIQTSLNGRVIELEQQSYTNREKRSHKDFFYPPSPAQELIYLDLIRDPNTTKYNITKVFQVNGDLDIKRFERAIRTIIKEHDVLSSQFKRSEGKIVSYKSEKEFVIEITEEDIRSIQHSKAFDLENDLLLRVVFVKNQDKNYLIFDSHHLILDGASVAILLHFIQNTVVFGEDFLFANDTESYKTYVDWYNNYRNSPDYQQKLINTCHKLIGYEPTVLPQYKMKNNESISFLNKKLKQESLEALDKLTGAYGKSEFVTLLSAFYLTLYAFTGEENLLIGTPTAVRPGPEFEKMIGMFVNSIPLSITLSMNQTINDYIQQVSEVVAEGLSNQEVTNQDCLHYLKEHQHLEQSSLFSTLFLVENSLDSIEFDEFSLQAREDFDVVSADQVMTFRIRKSEEYIMDVNFDPSLYNTEIINSFFDTFERVLIHLADDRVKTVEEIKFISAETEKTIFDHIEKVVTKEIDPIVSYSLFEQFVSTRADEICIEGLREKITWKETDQQVSKVVNYLTQFDDILDRPIGLAFDRNHHMFVAILSVLKIGGCFVALDKKYSQQRKQEIMEETGMLYILADEDMDFSSEQQTVINITKLPIIQITNTDFTPADILSDPDKNMTIVFSSGTTGRPKGVQMSYRNFSHLHKNIDFLEVSQESRVLSITNFTFDVFLTSLSFMLYNGATTVLVDDQTMLDSSRLAQFTNQKGITHICCPTSIYHNFKEADVPYLKNTKLLVAGERMGYGQSKAFFGQGHKHIYNGYGPAESCVYSSYHLISEQDFESDFNEILIGKQLKENIIVLVDQYNRVLPKYARGEIVIFGNTLTAGYLNQKELTEERFTYEIIPGHRGFKTRDIAARVADDQYIYIDRIDTEIKIRGYRVNTKDVINEIEKHVTTNKMAIFSENNMLMCFIESDMDVEVNGLLARLRERLPSYMIPSVIQQVKAIPLNHNGKVDKKRLLELAANESNKSDNDPISFQDSTEKDLYHIWKKVLGNYASITRESNFFSVGGHSLKVMELQYEIEKTFHVRVPINILFEKMVLKEQAAEIHQHHAEFEILKNEITHGKRFPLTPFQESLYTLYLQDPKSTRNNIVLLSKIQNTTNINDLKRRIEQEVEQQSIFKTTFVHENGKLLQMLDERLSFSIEEEFIRNKDQIKSSIRPFDLHNDMLINVKIVHLPTETFLLVNIHHIIFDGESAKIFVENLLKRNHLEPVRESDYHFFDYATYIDRYRQSDQYTEDANYWKHLEGIKNVTWPYDFEEEVSREKEEVASVSELVSKEMHHQINTIAHRINVPKISVLMSAFHLAIGKVSSESSFAIGTSIGLRMDNEFKQTIGPFVNTLPIYAEINQNTAVSSFVKQLNQRYLDGIKHIHIGFPEMVTISKVERDKNSNPLFNVMFIYQPEYLSSHNEIEELGLTDGELLNVSEKFDLTMNFLDCGDHSKILVTFDANKYRLQTMNILIDKMMKILSEIHKNQEILIQDIHYQTEREKEILNSFPDYFDENPANETILSYWNTHVRECPEKICIEKEEVSYTFLEIDQMANYLVSEMQNRGVNQFDRVGFLFDRSIEMYVSLISILKVGACYVPLEIEAEDMYLQGLINDAGIKLLLTENKFKERLTAEQHIVVSLDQCLEIDINESYDSTATLGLLYTSGTTGKPKGILISHDNMINLSNAEPGNKITRQDTLIQIANYTFDISSVTFFNSIIRGAKLLLCEKSYIYEIDKLTTYMKEKNVTYVFLPTAIFHLFEKERLKQLNGVTFIAGGEVMSKHKLKDFLEIEHINIYNMYGPTETSVYSTIHHVEKLDKGPIPIGKPVENTVVKVINDANTICEVGEIGEFYIGGRGVSKGYLNLEEETAKRFVKLDGRTFYRTGDFVRITSHGQIEFLGRRDKQVKINGVRIELHEIENAIKKEFMLNKMTIIYHKNQLLAFIEDEFDKVTLQNNVKKILSSYKCPSDYIKVGEIPLTVRGKIDERKLIRLYEESVVQKEFSHNEIELNPAEIELRELWSKVLKLPSEAIGKHDNFFEIGGSSIQAISLVSQMRKAGMLVEFEDLITFQTINEMSIYLNSKGEMDKQESVPNSFDDVVIVFPAYMEETIYKEISKQLMSHLKDKTVYILDFYYEKDYIEHYTNKVIDIIEAHGGNIYLFGYSFGGVLAHEVSINLKLANYRINGIVMLDSYFAKWKDFYKKMLRGTFLSKNLAAYQLEKAYPQFKEIDKDLKFELIEKFERFYKLTNTIKTTNLYAEVPLYFVKSQSSMKNIEDTRGEWKNIYTNQYFEYNTPVSHTNMMKFEELEVMSEIVKAIFEKELQGERVEVGSYGN